MEPCVEPAMLHKTGYLLLLLLLCLITTDVHCANLTNVAAASNGATCSANRDAFKADVGCYGALDGSIYGSNARNVWMFYGNANATIFHINFDNTYEISKFSAMQPFWGDEKNFKMVELVFSDGSRYKVSLTNTDGYYWDEFVIDPPVVTSEVTIGVVEEYTSGRNTAGFVEVEFYGELPTNETDTTSTAPPTTTVQSTPFVSTAPQTTTAPSTVLVTTAAGLQSTTQLQTTHTATTKSLPQESTTVLQYLTTTSLLVESTSLGSPGTSSQTDTSTAPSSTAQTSPIASTEEHTSPYPTNTHTSTQIAGTTTPTTTEATTTPVVTSAATTGGQVLTPAAAGASTNNDGGTESWVWIVVVVVIVILILQVIVLVVIVFVIKKWNRKNVRVSPDEADQEREENLTKTHSFEQLHVPADSPALTTSGSSWKERDIYGDIRPKSELGMTTSSVAPGTSYATPRAAAYTTDKETPYVNTGTADFRDLASRSSNPEWLTTGEMERLTALTPQDQSVTLEPSYPEPSSSPDSGDIRVDNSDVDPMLKF